MISVVITTYGTGEHWQQIAAERAIPSAKAEEPYEVIVHHEPGLEIGPARNNAATLASGEWLLFLDADDELAPGYLDAMTNAICSPDRPEPALLQPAVRYVRKNNYRAPAVMLGPKDLRHDNYLVIGTVLRRSLFMQVGGFNDYPHGFEDWSLWAKCWKEGATVYPVPDSIYNAHVNPQSKHRQLWRDRQAQVAMHLRVQAELFPECTSTP